MICGGGMIMIYQGGWVGIETGIYMIGEWGWESDYDLSGRGGKGFWVCGSLLLSIVLSLYPPYPKDRGMLWFYVEAARRPPPAMVLTR